MRCGVAALASILGLLQVACSGGKSDRQAEAPPPLKIQRVEDRNLFQVERPERFQLAVAVEYAATSRLQVTGTVNPDISRAVPVISLASGRVLEIRDHTSATDITGIGKESTHPKCRRARIVDHNAFA